MAQLVPPGADAGAAHLASVRGWLGDDDPYFQILDAVVAARSRHVPRVIAHRSSGRRVQKK